MLHFSITFIERYWVTGSMVKRIQNREVQFNTILIGNHQSIIDTFNLLEKMPRSMGNQLVGYINTNDFQNIRDINIENLGHIDNLEDVLKKHNIEEAILAFDKKNPQDITMIIH